eukprot:scaffold1280_cov246-Pinguiococcus_pyrenoidosus.AAC.18
MSVQRAWVTALCVVAALPATALRFPPRVSNAQPRILSVGTSRKDAVYQVRDRDAALMAQSILLMPQLARAGFFQELGDKAETSYAERTTSKKDQAESDGVDNSSSALIQDLLQKSEAKKAQREKLLKIEMFEKSQSGFLGPFRKYFAVINSKGEYQLIPDDEFERLKKAGRITEDRDLLPEP